MHRAVGPASAGLSKKELKADATRISEGDWAAKAVRQAIDSLNAAVIAAISAAAVVGASGSG